MELAPDTSQGGGPQQDGVTEDLVVSLGGPDESSEVVVDQVVEELTLKESENIFSFGFTCFYRQFLNFCFRRMNQLPLF